MADNVRIKYLRIALWVVGLVFIFGLYPFTVLWPSSWSWHATELEYPEMLLGVYATLGVFLIIAARNPLAHRSLISFTAWSSFVHSGIMAVQALSDPRHIGHLWGDVLGLFIAALALAILLPRKSPAGMS